MELNITDLIQYLCHVFDDYVGTYREKNKQMIFHVVCYLVKWTA